MTPEQVQNWRVYLSGTKLGPYAFFMPVNQIEKFRDMLQVAINELPESQPKPEPVIDADGRCQHKVNARHCKICGTKPKRRF